MLNIINSLVPVLIAVGAGVFAEDIHRYTICIGREEIFRVDLDNLLEDEGIPVWSYGRGVSQPLYHPFRFAANFVALGYIVVVPVVYVAIFRFRRDHDRQVPGKILRMPFINSREALNAQYLKMPNAHVLMYK